jgi:hypothetical protein
MDMNNEHIDTTEAELEALLESDSHGLNIEVLMQKPTKTGVYSGRFGGQSTQVCTASVDYAGLTIEAEIWARRSADRNTNEVRTVVEPSLPKGVKFDSEEFAEDFKATIFRAVNVNLSYNALEAKAIARLDNPASVAGSTGSRRVITATVQK